MFISRVYRKWLSIKYFKIYCSKFLNKKNLSKFPQWTVTQILTILLTFFKIVVRPLITKENLYLEILIRHSLLCSVLTLVCVFCCPVFIGSWKKKKKLSLHLKTTKKNSISHENHDIFGKFYQPQLPISISSSNFLYIIAFMENLIFFGNFNRCSFLSGNLTSLFTKLNPYLVPYMRKWWVTEIDLFPCS